MRMRLFLIVLLVIVGIWMGINFARGKPLFSNPFADDELRSRAGATASKVVKESSEAIEHKLKGD